MRALGLHFSKQEVADIMERIDKDGSGQLEIDEFTALMSEILYRRNGNLEMRKVFRFYDNDDDGSITPENIYQAADQLELEDLLNEENVNMMIEMGDPKKRGFVDEEAFIQLMKEFGLILP